jgi:hypothetical protein
MSDDGKKFLMGIVTADRNTSPGMESSRGDELHSHDNGNYSQGIQKTLESVFRGTFKMIPSKL